MPRQFQSAPGGEAGGKRDDVADPGQDHWFQSAPGGEAGGKVIISKHRRMARYVSIRPRR